MEKMTLKGYYDSLSPESPQLRFKKTVMAACNISTSTFYNWIRGAVAIPDEAKPIIAEVANKSTEELFSDK